MSNSNNENISDSEIDLKEANLKLELKPRDRSGSSRGRGRSGSGSGSGSGSRNSEQKEFVPSLTEQNENYNCFNVLVTCNNDAIITTTNLSETTLYQAEVDSLYYGLEEQERNECMYKYKYGSGSQLLRTILKSLMSFNLGANFFVSLFDAATILAIKGVDIDVDLKEESDFMTQHATPKTKINLAGYLLLKRNLTFYETFGFFISEENYYTGETNFSNYVDLLTKYKELGLIDCRGKLAKIKLSDYIQDGTDWFGLVSNAYNPLTPDKNKRYINPLLNSINNLIVDYLDYFNDDDEKSKLTFKSIIKYGSNDDKKPSNLGDDRLPEFLNTRTRLIAAYCILVFKLDSLKLSQSGMTKMEHSVSVHCQYFDNYTLGIYKRGGRQLFETPIGEGENKKSLYDYFLEKGCVLIGPECISQLQTGVVGGTRKNSGSKGKQGRTPEAIFKELDDILGNVTIIDCMPKIVDINSNVNINYDCKPIIKREMIKKLKIEAIEAKYTAELTKRKKQINTKKSLTTKSIRRRPGKHGGGKRTQKLTRNYKRTKTQIRRTKRK
jgi:hypothetical protein